MKLAFVGYGALGRQIESLLDEAGSTVTNAVYLDDELHRSGAAGARPFKTYDSDELVDHSFFVCLGYKHLALKKQIIDRLVELGRSLPSLVHESSYVHHAVALGSGTVIYPGCNVDRNTTIGRGVCLINGTVIAHDCVIGDNVWISPGVTLSGKVTVGERTFIGSGSTIANDVEIGAGAIIGVGTVVTKHVPAGASVIGNPMRVLERPLKLI